MMTDKAEANMIELSDEMLDDVSGGSLVGTVYKALKTIDGLVDGVGDTAGEAAGTVGGFVKDILGGLLGGSSSQK